MWDGFSTYLFYDIKLSTSKGSFQSLKSRFVLLCKHFDTIPLNRVTFNQYIGLLKEKQYKDSYINNFIKTAKHLDRYLGINQLQDYTYFKEKRGPVKNILSPGEIRQLADIQISYLRSSELINKRQKTLIFLLGTTGCRIQEALKLKWTDINEDCVIFRDTKNGEERVVPIGEFLYIHLMSLQNNYEYIFTSWTGNLLCSSQMGADFRKRAKTVGITKHIHNHLFRHSWITTMLEAGVDLSDVSILAGHKDPRSTMVYKNSMLNHYKNIINYHPLVRAQNDPRHIIRIVKTFLSNLGLDIDSRLAYKLDEGANSINFSLFVK